MFQHFLVGLIFAICLFLLIRHIVDYLAHAKKGNVQYGTCSETSCPLCGAKNVIVEEEKYTKKGRVIKNCKKRPR